MSKNFLPMLVLYLAIAHSILLVKVTVPVMQGTRVRTLYICGKVCS